MKIRLYHNILFLIGFIYYLLLPLWIVVQGAFGDYPGMKSVYQYFSFDYVLSYCIIITIFFISFYLGSFLPLKFIKKERGKPSIDLIISSRDLFIISLPFFFLGQYTIMANAGNLFQGYLVEYDDGFMGTISTINMVFLFLYIYSKGKLNVKNYFIDLYLVSSLVEFSIILLGMGSRMYILIPCVTCTLYFLDKGVISIKKVLVGGLIAVLFFLFIGIWRLGDSGFSIDSFLYIGIAEPVFTWISVESMFSSNELPLIAIPYNFFSSFLNFVPTLLFPNKAEFIQPITLNYDNPFGATSLLVSLIANFGILGSCFVLFLLGFFLTSLRLNGRTLFTKTYYYCICGIIPFQLFRDSIPIVNKMLFYNFLLFPFLLFSIEKLLCKKSIEVSYDENNS